MTASSPPNPLPERPPSAFAVAAASSALTLMLGASAWFWVQRAQRDAVVPGDAQFSAAETLVRAGVRPGDAMAFLPSWTAGQRWRFSTAFADAGIDFRRAMVFTEPLSAWDLDGYARLWLLLTHDRAASFAPERLGRLLARHELGRGTALLLVGLPESRTVLDFGERLQDARVRRVGADGAVQECTPAAGRQRCPGPWWRSLSVGLHETGHTRHRCVFVQPAPPRGSLHLRFETPPPAARLAGHFGNQLWAVRHETGSDLVMRVLIDGRERLRLSISRGDFGWHPWELRLSKAERGRPIELVFSSKDPTWRQACFDARLVGAPADE